MSFTSEYEPDNEPTPSDEAVSSDEPLAAKRRKPAGVADVDDADDAEDFDSLASSFSRPASVKAKRPFPAGMPLTSNWEVNGDDDSDFEVVGVLGHTWERARALHRVARHQARHSSGRAPDREIKATTSRVQTTIANGSKWRRYKNTKHKPMKMKVASRHDQTIIVETPQFGDDQVFASWDEFWAALNVFMATHFVLFRKRSSQTAKKNSQNLENEVYAYVPFEIPEDRFEMARMVYWCPYGCLEPSRGSGKRTQNHLRFTECLARFIAVVAKQPNGELGIVVHDENAMHNHQVNEEIYQHLKLNKIIPTDMLVRQVGILHKANASVRHLTEFISSEVVQELSTQHGRNFLRSRFGGPSVEEKVLRFANDYTSTSGNHCLIIQDNDDVMAGLVLVNNAQIEMHKSWGEVLLFDWTHHTNNRGFYLGELMVTAAHGKGVLVCEMLVLVQTKEAMKRCLEFFTSLVDATKTETFIIDKDFTEWIVINESLSSAKVLLCQFYAIYAIQRALADPKYGIKLGDRKEIEIGFREAMYALIESEYMRRWKWLRKECQKICPHLGEYLQRNWDSCRDMWATHARCQHFTACNTTNNRIEATWKQMKSMLNLTTTLDNCLAAILLYQNNTMIELRRELVDKQSKIWYDPKETDTIRELG